ncbi:hypothetical protein OG589_16150 [Sphaerisporangium sp. NBC_01403]|uniref:hypothetical protein n=1 Tax=Sphaerisporangium sp. NBC_01403 TaxID=2903599 RepID=UPI00324DEAF4
MPNSAASPVNPDFVAKASAAATASVACGLAIGGSTIRTAATTWDAGARWAAGTTWDTASRVSAMCTP